MVYRIVPGLIIASMPFMLTGCESIGSEDIRTSGIYAKLTAIDNNSASNDVQVRVELVVGGSSSNTYVDINETGDSLTVSRDGTARVPNRQKGALGDIYYTYTFGGVTNTPVFNVNLSRNEDTSAPNSSVTMPEPFTINKTGSIFSITDNTAIDFTWTPADFSSYGNVSYSIGGSCVNTISGSLNLTAGSLTINAAEFGGIQANSDNTIPTSCGLNARFTHRNSGTVDNAYKGGYFHADRVVSHSLTIEQ